MPAKPANPVPRPPNLVLERKPDLLPVRLWRAPKAPSRPVGIPLAHLVDRIVIPVEGSDHEFFAQQWAVEMARELRVHVQAVHVNPIGSTHGDVFGYLKQEADRWHVPLVTLQLEGDDVVEELLPELGPRDLVVIGTRHMASDFHLGSVAASLVKRAPCPVQILRIP